jgi:hypothetical protein
MEDETPGSEHGMIGTSLEVEQLDKDLCVPKGTPRTFGNSSKSLLGLDLKHFIFLRRQEAPLAGRCARNDVTLDKSRIPTTQTGDIASIGIRYQLCRSYLCITCKHCMLGSAVDVKHSN